MSRTAALVVLVGVLVLSALPMPSSSGAPRTPAPGRSGEARIGAGPPASSGPAGAPYGDRVLPPVAPAGWDEHRIAALASYSPPGRLADLALPRAVHPRSGTDIVLGGSDILVISANTTVGNITLSGSSVLVVQNATAPVTLTIDGNILLEQHSTFYAENRSNLVANESFDNQLSLTLEDESFFLVVGANTSANGHQWIGEVVGNANMSVIGSHYCYPSSWFPVTIAGERVGLPVRLGTSPRTSSCRTPRTSRRPPTSSSTT